MNEQALLLNGLNEIKYNGDKLFVNGYNWEYTYDCVWDTDKSYIAWSNQKLLNNIMEVVIPDIQKNIDNSFNSEQLVNIHDWKNNILTQANLLQMFFDSLEKMSKAQKKAIDISLTTIDLIDNISELEKVKDILSAQKYIEKITNIINSWTKFKSNTKLPEVMIKSIEEIGNRIITSFTDYYRKFKNSLAQFKFEIANMNTLFKSISYISLALDLKDAVANFWDFMKDYNDSAHINMKSLTNTLLGTARVICSAISLAGTAFPPAQLIAATFSFVDAIISNWDQGNGYNLYENWHDHGLNDWRFQVKNNFRTLVQIAAKKSDYLQKGIVWKITDGWFSYPDLYIAQQLSVEDDPAHIPSSNWLWLSPGNEFNFANYVKDLYV